jgi:hypothetical protein
MGMRTEFNGTLTTSRPLTEDELQEYKNAQRNHELNQSEMYLSFVDDSNDTLQGPEDGRYFYIVKGFVTTLDWMKSKGITLSGRINYVYEDMFIEIIGEGFGAFVVTPEKTTYYQLDFDGLQIISSVVYSN